MAGSLLYAFDTEQAAREYLYNQGNIFEKQGSCLQIWEAQAQVVSSFAPCALWDKDFDAFWSEYWYANKLYDPTKMMMGIPGSVWCEWIKLLEIIPHTEQRYEPKESSLYGTCVV